MSGGEVTITLTGPQAEVVHEVLSMVIADPGWIDMIGGQREMDTLTRAHSRLRDRLRAARTSSR